MPRTTSEALLSDRTAGPAFKEDLKLVFPGVEQQDEPSPFNDARSQTLGKQLTRANDAKRRRFKNSQNTQKSNSHNQLGASLGSNLLSLDGHTNSHQSDGRLRRQHSTGQGPSAALRYGTIHEEASGPCGRSSSHLSA